MARLDVLDILRAKKQSPLEFNFDNLEIPPMWYYLSPDDVEGLRKIATSLKLSSKIDLKYKMIDDIMRNRGFKRFSAGTNRVVYSCLEDDRFVVKIAVDRVGMQDNPMEYKNQSLIKPYCTKMFYISPCGTVGFSERVLPIKNKEEYRAIAGDVFEILINKILGKYVMEDIGTKYFMNVGLRYGYGPVLLDYPYLYKLDGKKLYCTKVDPSNGQTCNGEIDYDAGFNHLVCSRCGKIYLATDLRDDSVDNKIIIKGGNQMKVALKIGDKVVSNSIATDDVIERPKKNNGNVLLTAKAVGGRLGDNSVEPITEEAPRSRHSIDITVKTNASVDNTEAVEKKDFKAPELPKITDEDLNIRNEEETDAAAIREAEDPKIENAETTLVPSTEDESTNEEINETKIETSNEGEDEDSDTEVTTTEEDPAPEPVDEIEEKYSQYDDYEDGGSNYQPIRKKNVNRGPDGKFISSGNGKKKTNNQRKPKQNFIPSK